MQVKQVIVARHNRVDLGGKGELQVAIVSGIAAVGHGNSWFNPDRGADDEFQDALGRLGRDIAAELWPGENGADLLLNCPGQADRRMGTGVEQGAFGDGTGFEQCADQRTYI